MFEIERLLERVAVSICPVIGITGEGKSYSLNIVKALEIMLNCRWIKSGAITIKPENFDLRSVDYGNGNCDRLATYTVNGKNYQFSMR